ncbi:MAG: ATP-binding protein [Cyclobacteriaceae bacterium]
MSDSSIVVILGTTGMLFMAVSIIIFVFLYQRKVTRKELELRKTQQMLSDLEISATYSFLEGQQKEQQRIAADLHDSIGSQLGLIGLQLRNLAIADKGLLQPIEEMVNTALAEVRGISHRLHKGLFRGSNLDTAIQQIVAAISQSANVTINYQSHGLEDNPSEEAGREFFRIIQELFSNTIKHANATEINIDISYFKGDYCTLMFTDNGRGFDTESNKEGIGMTTIRDRVATLNGKLYVSSKPAKGTETVIEIKL